MSRDIFAFSLVEASDGGFALAGRTSSRERDDYALLVKTDAYGNMVWNQTYGEGGSYYSAFSLVEISDGGYVVAGCKQSSLGLISEFLLIKTDSNGNMLWNQTYDGAGYDETYSLIETSDGGFAVVGNTRLVKSDTNGNLEWSRTYDEGAPNSLVETSSRGYVLAGDIISSNTGHSDFWLAKTDEYGVIPEFPLWTPLLIMLVAVAVLGVIYRRKLHN